jgi:hypothetical protein
LIILISGNGPVVLQFNASANTTYTILHRPSLSSGAWQRLVDIPAGPARTVQHTDPSGSGSRFYWLRAPRLP